MNRWIIAVAALLTVVSAGCSPGAREAAPFQGIWHSSAWGMYLTINGGSIAIYEATPVHCVEVAAGGARGIGDVLALDGAELVLTDAGRTIRFERQEVLPIQCAEPVDDSPPAVFDVVVATFEAHYAPGLDADWDSRVATLRPPVGASQVDLQGALEALLEPLDRPDVRLSTGRDTWAARSAMGSVVADSPIESELPAGGIAYLAFHRLGGFKDDVPGSQRVAADAIDRAVESSTRLILDLRSSSGGSVDHAMLVASRFVPEPSSVVELWARGPGGLTPAGEVAVQPLPTGTFAGSAAVLIGPGTVGVAELLAQALRDVPGVTLVGQETFGAAGPGMVRFLPNGWSIGLPNLRVVLPDGTVLHGVVPETISDDALSAAREILG